MHDLTPPRGQLLKWIGNKQRFAAAIVATFPRDFGTYWEPFVGAGAVVATLRPERAVASDVLRPLVEVWRTLQADPARLVADYAERRARLLGPDKVAQYLAVRTRYNAAPNAADLVLLARACYGGVIRFSKKGTMNTPCGIHRPIPSEMFAKRVSSWRERVARVRFEVSDFDPMLDAAVARDLVYCDPPYSDSAGTLYGAQAFTLSRLLAAIERAKARGVRVALSIDGSKRSGRHECDLPLPPGLFETELRVDVGRSMLRRFQMEGQTLEHERVADRLLLTWVWEPERATGSLL
ncbi:MAG: Dam family site-specific DNA-(adenine-N6)-methyltransferase [Myxococcales bacterium]|nr:Dam family site-specific DNA-(adenine-N6)-methyltransferase [Myxococcales bacterium]